LLNHKEARKVIRKYTKILHPSAGKGVENRTISSLFSIGLNKYVTRPWGLLSLKQK
jgi:hypothetical protein